MNREGIPQIVKSRLVTASVMAQHAVHHLAHAGAGRFQHRRLVGDRDGVGDGAPSRPDSIVNTPPTRSSMEPRSCFLKPGNSTASR